MAHLAYKFRLYPNRTQECALSSQLETLRRVYNDALQLSKDVYAATKKTPKRGYLYRVLTLSRNSQIDDQKEGRGGPKWLTQISAVTLRDTCARVETAFDNFFRRLKLQKGKAGFPRFKKYGRLTSIPFENTYPSGCVIRGRDGKIVGDRVKSKSGNGVRDIPALRSGYRLDVFGVGLVKLFAHRPVTGIVKTACVERDVDGKWYVVLVVDVGSTVVEPKTGEAVGIDVGLEKFLTMSDGRSEDNPRFLKHGLKAIRKAQRLSSRKMEAAKRRKVKFRDCKNLQRSFRVTSKLHVRVRNLRKENHHQVSNRLVREFAVICAEKLNVRGMVRNGKLSRAIQDAGWSGFLNVLRQKCVRAGAQFVEVNASGTSQTCPECGAVAKKKLSQRVHRCPCGYVANRDHAAARIILARGLAMIRGSELSGSDSAVRVQDSNAVGMPCERSHGERRGQLKSPCESDSQQCKNGNRSRKSVYPAIVLGGCASGCDT